MNRLRNAGVIWIVACALTLFPPGRSARAAVLMYDGFDYTVGTSLTNQAGGTGWGAATNYWKGTVTEGVNSNSTIVAGLTFSDYQVAGNAVQLCASNAIVIRYGRKIQTGAVGDIWMSYLYRPDVNRGQYNFSAIQCNVLATR